MELREFAEQVLFSTTLEGKLWRPDAVTDERPGPAIVAPRAPGRPPSLQFRPSGQGKADFPGLQALETEAERGRLLHFFANHELLATELMALALLRFPDAPTDFRRGLYRTLLDEQDHTRLYVERMRSFGVDFGERPVSGFFWRAVSGMEHPIDYVSGLCLTFEQANLDYCRHFAAGFGGVGDEETGQLLDRIYRDEIGHVAYGLKWFRRWKNPGERDWDAFCRQLKFPLTPQRAKGAPFNAEGRRAAGLDAGFIAELDVYAQSRGRTPTVFLFNPFTEGYLARGGTFHPVQHQAKLAADLATLPQFLGREDDVVLVPRRPGTSFLAGLRCAGLPLPEFVKLAESPAGGEATGAATVRALQGRKLGRLRPWAWGPDSLALLRPLFPAVTGERRAPEECFSERIAPLYSKAWSAGFLRSWLGAGGPGQEGGAGDTSWLCGPEDVGHVLGSLKEVLEVVAAIRARGHHRVVVKEALGLAGGNALRLWEPAITEAQRRWIARSVEGRRQVVVEPWHDRDADFSVQLEMESGGLRLLGYTGLAVDHQGRYRANWADADHSRRLPRAVTALFPAMRDAVGRLHHLYLGLAKRLEVELNGLGFRGPLGLDAFVYRAPDGTPRLKPIVEINPRHTMGRVALELMRHVCPGRGGILRLVTCADVRAAGMLDFVSYARERATRLPVQRAGEPVPRIREGWLCLTDPDCAEVCLATFEVGQGSHAS